MNNIFSLGGFTFKIQYVSIGYAHTSLGNREGNHPETGKTGRRNSKYSNDERLFNKIVGLT
jgi:hypothetical protein